MRAAWPGAPDTSDASALAVRLPSGRVTCLVRRSRPSTRTVSKPRGRAAPWTVWNRRPIVVVSAKHRRMASSSRSGATSTCTWVATRPFLPKTTPCTTSWTPGMARMWSSPFDRSSADRSSTSKVTTPSSRWENRLAGAVPNSAADSKARTRRQFEIPAISRAPKPVPLRAMRRGRGAAFSDPSRRWRATAAPVGVTRSPGMPSSTVSRPRSSSAVAGAGTGRMPWAVLTRPEPSGRAGKRSSARRRRAR